MSLLGLLSHLISKYLLPTAPSGFSLITLTTYHLSVPFTFRRQHGAPTMLARAGRLSGRAQVLASAAGAAAPLWERLNALASRPGMVNMSQGMPDFAGSPIARRVAAEALETGGASLNQYSPQPGLIDLRQAVSAFVDQRYGATYDPATEVAITAGGQEESDPLSPLLCPSLLCLCLSALRSYASQPLSLFAP